ncbi:MAG: right-handed parallel beta-helix repeat-containing protein [Deltaproteobacteria bacterium]|nr:right-handed parallel beta-helix repeat-containing protein [Deltaproteobacteria bacterium]
MPSKRLRTSAFLSLVLLTAASIREARAATTWGVPGDSSNTCTVVVPSCNTIAQAVTASSSGDTILIGAGSFPVPSSIALTKSLTITGAGIGTTFVQPTTTAFSVRTSNIVFSDFTLQNGAIGIAFQSASSNNTQITRVAFSGQTSRGIDVSLGAAFPVTNVAITDSSFATANIGIRTSSTAQVAGLTITGTSFTGNKFGIYVANDNNTSKFSGLTIQNSTFTNNVNWAIYAEEMRDALIEDSTFTGGGTAIGLFKFYGSSGVAMSNITIRENTFSAFTGNALDLEVYLGGTAPAGVGLENPVVVQNNTIQKDVGIATSSTAVFVRLPPALTNAPVNILDNDILISGTFSAGTRAYGVTLRGNGPVVMTGNVIDGGNVGGSGTTPPTSGIFIQSQSAPMSLPSGTFPNVMPATVSITASCNRIQGFRNGVSVFDSIGNAYGGLQVGATVTIEDNAILGNDSGLVTGAAAPTIDGENNYWGCPAGPSDAACDDVVGDVDADPFRIVIAPCVPCLQNSECNDGLFCNGAETCDLQTSQCVAAVDPCLGGPACGNTCNEVTDDCFVPAGTVCRAAVDACDAEETCSGLGGPCPGDVLLTAGSTCRPATDVCDAAETCDGVSAACPADALQGADVVCRTAAGSCDVAENCSGSAAACPVDGFAPAGQECRASAGVCDVAESCTGSGPNCPVDAFQPPATVCRAAAGVCDIAETCAAGNPSCPPDAVEPATTVCRAAAGACDVAENCNGSGTTCPSDGFAAAGTNCSDGDFCTQPDVCDGSGICDGPAVDCDDANPCTDDACDSQAGGFLCVYTNNGSCIGPNCGNEVVDAGETCDPPNLAIDPITNQAECRLDCTSCGDGVVQANDQETCDDGNTIGGCRLDKPQKPIDDCLNSCRLPICDDPSRIKLTSGLDQLAFHGRLITSAGIDFSSEHLVIQLSSSDGTVLYRDSLLAGAISQTTATAWKYRNKLAKQQGGVYALKVRGKDGAYAFTMQAYGDGSAAVADMRTQVFVGSNEWALRGRWTELPGGKGWRLNKKSEFLEP